MATDLFGKYFNDPKKQYIFTDMRCKKGSADELHFHIEGSEGVISNNISELSKIDLSGIQDSLTEWKNESRIIEPHDYVYFKGFSQGLAYQRNVFLRIPQCLLNNEYFLYITGIAFNIKYRKGGCPVTSYIEAQGNWDKEISFLDAINEKMEDAEIPVKISLVDDMIVFESEVLGYEYYISTDLHTNTIRLFTNDVVDLGGIVDVYLNDFDKGYVPPRKYRNGAFKGIVLVPTYPQFNADNIHSEQKALYISHIKDRIDKFYPIDADGKILYDKVSKDVIDSYEDIAEKEKFDLWRFSEEGVSKWKEWFEADEKHEDKNWDESKIGDAISAGEHNRNITGIYGFINWAWEHNNFNKFGSLYTIIAPTDTADTDTKNLIPSFIVYNPNDFPIQISSILFN